MNRPPTPYESHPVGWRNPAGSGQGAPPPPESDARAAGSSGFALGKLFGIEVRVDWSLLIIFALITVSLGGMTFPAWHPEWGALRSWSLAFVAAVLFFASVLAHELSHAVVGRKQGIAVSRITLFLFGGMAHMEHEPPSPKSELLMTIVGPLTSAVIGVSATLAGSALAAQAIPDTAFEDPMSAMSHVGPAATLLLWLGPLNIVLAIFNMVPGFPLDGGRILRAIVWWKTGDMVKATRWASGAGRLFGWTLMAFGVFNVFSGGLMQGMWLILIGWFLSSAALQSYQRVLMTKVLSHVPVSRVMRTKIDSVSPDLSIDELVREHLIASDQHGFPVEEAGQLLGLVTMQDVRKVPQADWPHTRVRNIMTRESELTVLPPEADAEKALDALARRDVEQIPIVEHGHVLGLLRRADLVKWMALQGIGGART